MSCLETQPEMRPDVVAPNYVGKRDCYTAKGECNARCPLRVAYKAVTSMATLVVSVAAVLARQFVRNYDIARENIWLYTVGERR
jgi:hypothetical protein